MNDYDIAIVGCGNMGAALVSGYLGRRPESRILVIDPDVARAESLLPKGPGVTLSPTLAGLDGHSAGLAVIAVKPQSCAALLPELSRTTASEGLVLSIAAGVSVDALRKGLPNARIVRCMPNTPAMVGAGTSVIWCGPEVAEGERSLCQTLLRSFGTVEWVPDEALIDVATAISGSGPAYVFAFTEALAHAGERMGLESGLAARLARGTVTGAASMLSHRPAAPGELKAAVRSPAGTTDAALKVFETDDRLAELVRHAVEAARRRADELRRSFA